MMIARLACAWASVLAFQFFGSALLGQLGAPIPSLLIFAWLLGVIVWSAFGVVHEADELAHRLGEPYGTLILTLSIVIIEVALISAVMLGAKGAPTLGRDTMFAVLMIVLNGVVGIGLLLGGLRHFSQGYNLKGASAYLAVIIPLTLIPLVLPNFTTSTADGTLTTFQSIAFSLFTLLLYGAFLILQTGRHSVFFQEPAGESNMPYGAAYIRGKMQSESGLASQPTPDPGPAEEPPHVTSGGSTQSHVILLLLNILPIVILAKSLATVLDFGIASLGAPVALGGILIAMVVFTPECIAALRAITTNQLQRAINLCLGAAASTLGLTVPAVLVIGLITGQPVVLGLSGTNMVILAMTLLLSTLTFTGTRTTMLEGAVHLSVFFVFLVLVFSP
ncbi:MULTISPECIES: calcium:proton antiporter [unclassified Bosea (in: a-proteobacteria)]|uniref:calcium:proton antiporter n=1 Tax=unclassified Bosea (in: a-proteobacteria) TaxID=2653178 RepID=UPI000F75D487|nr:MULTISPECIES: calcium:proton antiporter [unclassified Bosea (in: a-proteobacteria)]AZO81696.1 calcium:proton antiporter [Bosea sp. Tri-49]RXT23472.1 calcium:proton antiporter [Bosea sp. Tri-39]RXT38943.1 calcium:proton antiporter [Bosea sp. Tri-54]